jgi:hypothetical protein
MVSHPQSTVLQFVVAPSDQTGPSFEASLLGVEASQMRTCPFSPPAPTCRRDRNRAK